MLNAVSATWAILRRPILVAFYETHGDTEYTFSTKTPGSPRGPIIRLIRLSCIWLTDTYDFSSATAERILTNLERKHVIKVLYQVCYFSGRSASNDGRPGLWLAVIFSTSSLQPMGRFWWSWTGGKCTTFAPILTTNRRGDTWPAPLLLT